RKIVRAWIARTRHDRRRRRHGPGGRPLHLRGRRGQRGEGDAPLRDAPRDPRRPPTSCGARGSVVSDRASESSTWNSAVTGDHLRTVSSPAKLTLEARIAWPKSPSSKWIRGPGLGDRFEPRQRLAALGHDDGAELDGLTHPGAGPLVQLRDRDG